ncbi:MAG: acetate/propionate family kinase [Desulfuromonadales bacterium]|nr:acetate/propionate family kinase [Desulfuromonadales bacterium]
MNVLVINCGSSSIKYQVVDTEASSALVKGKIERLNGAESYDQALKDITDAVSGYRIDAIGHRVVHGGDHFSMPQLIDNAMLAMIESCVPLAPLHNPANLTGINAARKILTGVPHVAVFDTAFHSRMPRRALTYAIDAELADSLKIRRYGFHGISHAYVAQKAAEYLGSATNQLRLVTCHLGNGASACAVEFGTSTETSMGMTPLEGLVMGTRCGDIDPAAVLKLVREKGYSTEEVEHLLNRQSGLLGLSGISKDLRDIEAKAAEGNERARLSIAVFSHRVRKYIGAYAATMGGIDAVVLTGGIGENSVLMRRRILQRLEFLGLMLDHDRNNDCRVSHEQPVAEICADHSRVRALVVATDEELMIARQTETVINAQSVFAERKVIPIAVHPCHVHLSRETFEQLFGKDAGLTKAEETFQPGQYVCRERVNLIGPRDRIDGVSVVGPLRERDQIEITRDEEFRLGVDAPVRPSGQVDGSAPITVEGPLGRVHLSEGLICARRHIHMSNEEAEHLGIHSGDEVEVAITGGSRDLVFRQVLVRISPDYRLEMHIDIDEASSAGLPIDPDGTYCRFGGGENIKAEILRHSYRTY